MNQVDAKKTTKQVTTEITRFFTVRKFAAKNRESGTWPASESAIWALRAGSPQNGFGPAFINVGRRVLISEEKFLEAVARLQGGADAK